MQNIKSGFTCGESSLCQNFAKFQNAMKKIVEYQLKKLSITLLCLNCTGVKLQILGKNSQVHLIIIREENDLNTPILRNLDNFPPGAFYSTPPPHTPHPPPYN